MLVQSWIRRPPTAIVFQGPMSWSYSSELSCFHREIRRHRRQEHRLLCAGLSSILPQVPNAGVYSSSDIESYKGGRSTNLRTVYGSEH
jgi:hypothetical protein